MMIGALAQTLAMASRIIFGVLGVVSVLGFVGTLSALAVLGIVSDALAERLPIRKFTTADGLAGEYIVSIYRDSRGFLWFCTRDGLSRFDGVRFVSYGTLDGLPSATINRVLETRKGVLDRDQRWRRSPVQSDGHAADDLAALGTVARRSSTASRQTTAAA